MMSIYLTIASLARERHHIELRSFWMCNCVVLIPTLLISFCKTKRVLYFSILYLQLALCVLFYLIPDNVSEKTGMKQLQLFALTSLLSILFNQMLISNLFIKNQNKFKYFVYLFVYIAFIYRFMGLATYVKYYEKDRQFFVHVVLALVGSYISQKMKVLQLKEAKEVEKVLTDLKNQKEADSHLKLVLESLEEGIIMLQDHEIVFKNQIFKDLYGGLL